MKRLIALIAGLALLSSLAVTASRALGASVPVDPDSFVTILRRDLNLIDGQWCWRQLCPGKTTAEQITLLLTDGVAGKNSFDPAPTVWRPYRGASWLVRLGYSDLKVLTSIGIGTEEPGNIFLPQVTMADVVVMYGVPARVAVNPDLRSVVQACYIQGLCVRTVTWGKPDLLLCTPLDTVSLSMPKYLGERLAKFPYRFDWRGFTSYYTENIW